MVQHARDRRLAQTKKEKVVQVRIQWIGASLGYTCKWMKEAFFGRNKSVFVTMQLFVII
jgi:hypothetical protein